MKNKEVRKIFFLQLLISLILICISFFISVNLYETYKQEQINTNANIVGALVTKYPYLEKDIIDSIINSKNYDEGIKILAKYGLNETTTLNYIKHNENIENKIFLCHFILIIITSTILTILSYLFIKKIYIKIRKIDLYMNDILNGNYLMDIKDYHEGDISNLKYDTYKMTVKLREQSELLLKEKIFLTETLEDISHQIKTPLTSMNVINDILEKEKNEKIRKEFLNKNRKQLNRIEWLISSLLTMARLDSGKIKLKTEKTNIKNIINEILDPINILLELKNINMNLNVNDFYINVDKNWTKEAISNIIKNAYEHTKNSIEITTMDNPLYTQIKIIDNGDGINKKDLPHIFKRFYKGEHNKESIGIGLNMSKKIINLQNGIIEVISNENGTTFIIKFYKNNL